jgi:antitoxin MazE
MRTTIQRWGNSLAVRSPKTLAQETAFGEGDEVDLRADDDRIVVERPRPTHYRLSDLLAGVTEANRHDAVDFGPPAPREAW